MKLNKRTVIRLTLSLAATAVLAYFASELIFGRVRARYHFMEGDSRLTVTVREKSDAGWLMDGLALLGYRPDRHTYWVELHSGRDLLADAEGLGGDTYYARHVEVRSADGTGATVSLGNQGEAEFSWRYR